MTLFHSRSAGSKSDRRPGSCRLQCEQLEKRLTPTDLTVLGTSARDSFYVYEENGHVVVWERNSDTYTDVFVGDTCLINAAGGADVIDVDDYLPANIPITIDGGQSLAGERDVLTTWGIFRRLTWDITGTNSGTISPMSLTFQHIEDLRCETNGDRFVMHPGGSISHSIDGGGPYVPSVLDYSQWSTGVRVNLADVSSTVTLANGTTLTLPAYTAPGIGGVFGILDAIGTNASDVLVGSSEDNILRGGGGNDELFGRSGADILIGGDGNDRLFGGGDRDILIGGRSSGVGALVADSLDGGSGEDILIGGYTSFDAYSLANDQSLLRIKNVWKSSPSYESRVTTLRMTSTTSVPSLGGTVFDDRGNDRLTGGKGRDWFHTEPPRSTPFLGTWQYDMILDVGYDDDNMPPVNEFVD